MPKPAFSIRSTRSSTNMSTDPHQLTTNLRQLFMDNAPRAGVAGLTTGFVIGLFFKRILKLIGWKSSQSNRIESDSDSDWEDDTIGNANEEYKLVLCVRTDLKMQKGKIGAQCGHATLGAYKSASRKFGTALKIWEAHGQPKIALQIGSMKQAMELQRKAQTLGLNTYMVHDSGRTQIAAGSMTVLAVGPGPVNKVNQVTGSLKLL